MERFVVALEAAQLGMEDVIGDPDSITATITSQQIVEPNGPGFIVIGNLGIQDAFMIIANVDAEIGKGIPLPKNGEPQKHIIPDGVGVSVIAALATTELSFQFIRKATS